MIKKLEITGVHMTVGEDLKSHVIDKIANLDKYVPRHARLSVHVAVKLKAAKAKNKEQIMCEVVMYLPGENLTHTETAQNGFAAVNVAEEKLKTQLHKYKELHASPKLRQRIAARFKSRAPIEL